MEITPKGYVYLCCPMWLPTEIGNVYEQSLLDIWNSQQAQDIRSSILDGSFSFCDKNQCPFLTQIGNPVLPIGKVADLRHVEIIQNKKVRITYPRWVNLSYDRSCNLACPSCRINFIRDRGANFSRLKLLQNRVVEELLPHIEWLYVTGSGDPFGSRLFRELLRSLRTEDYPELRIYLHTNGMLFNHYQWNKMEGIRRSVKWVQVSIDAATPSTYHKNRVGGKWDVLMDNLHFISQLRANGPVETFEISFVVQQNNFRQMHDFVKLGEQLGVDCVIFESLDNLTFSAKEYEQRAIHHSNHPRHRDFLAILSADYISHNPLVRIGTLGKLLSLYGKRKIF